MDLGNEVHNMFLLHRSNKLLQGAIAVHPFARNVYQEYFAAFRSKLDE
jgi:hypothetical protein